MIEAFDSWGKLEKESGRKVYTLVAFWAVRVFNLAPMYNPYFLTYYLFNPLKYLKRKTGGLNVGKRTSQALQDVIKFGNQNGVNFAPSYYCFL